MYQVYCDNYLLYHDNIENLKIFNTSLELEVNKTGSFEFTIYSDHPYFNMIRKMKSIITIWQDYFILFRGRVLNDEIGFYNQKTITCEGDLSFFLDSIQRPYEFTGSITDFLSMMITRHNLQVESSKQFQLGNVTVTDPEGIDISSNEYADTWKVVNKHLLDLHGGYISTRTEDGVTFIDYLEDFTLLSPQRITFGKNLLDLKRIRKGEDIATALIPLGAKLKDDEGKETDQRLTVASVNGGLDFISDQDAVDQYGFICTTKTWDDVTDPSVLMAKGNAYLYGLVKLPEIIELNAADLATVNHDVSSFHLGTYVKVKSDPHGIDQNFIVSKLSINILDPGSNKLVLGGTLQAFSSAVTGISDQQGQIIQSIEKTALDASEAVWNMEHNMQASIQVAEQNIISTVSEKYYLKDQTDSLLSSVRTDVEQTRNSFSILFSQFSADLAAIESGSDAEFEEIKKYIRFIDGKILLGAVGNELELQIANDRISFLQDGSEVAYFSNRKLYVTDAEFIHSLKIGNFTFMPRANGNLSFKKVNIDVQNTVGSAVVDIAGAV